jgi:hypothetical protein
MMMTGNATEEQQKDAMFIIILEQCRSVDKTFAKTGIDEETLQAALEKHKLTDDPEFKKILGEYVQKIQEKAVSA